MTPYLLTLLVMPSRAYTHKLHIFSLFSLTVLWTVDCVSSTIHYRYLQKASIRVQYLIVTICSLYTDLLLYYTLLAVDCAFLCSLSIPTVDCRLPVVYKGPLDSTKP